MKKRPCLESISILVVFLFSISGVSMALDGVNPNAVIMPMGQGEDINLRTGRLSWETTDLVIPGTAGMDVVVSRSYRKDNDGARLEMGSWRLEIPRILINTHPYSAISEGELGGATAICNKPKPVTGDIGNGDSINQAQTWTGLKLVIPGQSPKELLFKAAFLSQYPARADYVTTDHWIVFCGESENQIADSDTFLVKSPDGLTYRMNTRGHDVGRYEGADGMQREVAAALGVTTIYADWVKDLHGNQINYIYDKWTHPKSEPNGSRSASDWPLLDRISRTHSDGTSEDLVQFNYDHKTTGLPLLNNFTFDNKTWSYLYDDVANPRHLSRVVLPEGLSWEYAYNPDPFLNDSTAPKFSGYLYPNNVSVDPDRIDGIAHPFRMLEKVTTPGGATYTYEYAAFTNSVFGVPTQTYFHQVMKKTVDNPGVPSGSWSYVIQNTFHPLIDNNSAAATETTITGPDSVKKLIFSKDIGQLRQISISDLSTPDTPIYIEKSFFAENPIVVGTNQTANESEFIAKAYYSYVKQIEQGGVTYTTDVIDPADGKPAINIYGKPLIVNETGDIDAITGNSVKRTTGRTYQSNTDPTKWILSVPKSETIDGKTISRVINNKGQVTFETGYDGVQKTFVYYPASTKSAGMLHTITDIYDRETVYGESENGRASSVTRKVSSDDLSPSIFIRTATNLDGTIEYKRVVDGESDDITIPKITYTYDDLNRLATIDYPLGDDASITWSLNGDSQQQQQVVRGTRKTTTTYDGFMRPLIVKETDTGSNKYIVNKTEYDALGRVVSVYHASDTTATDKAVSYTYDALGRIKTEEVIGSGSSTTYDYLDNNKVQVTDPRGKITTLTHRSYGDPNQKSLVKVEAPEGVVQQIDRDALDQVTKITQGGFSREYVYNNLNQFDYEIHPETGTTDYTYYTDGNLQKKTVGTSGETVYSYDKLDRVVSVNYPKTESVDIDHMKYDRFGVKEIKKGNVTNQYNYDDNGNLKDEILKVGSRTFTTTFNYNGLDNVSSIQYPDSGTLLNYTPDALGRAQTVGSYITDVAYYANGVPSSMTHSNGLSATISQEYLTLRNDGVFINNDSSGDDRYSIEQLFDAAGNVFITNSHSFDGSIETAGFIEYRYNDINQFMGSDNDNASPIIKETDYDYDTRGNMGINENYVNNLLKSNTTHATTNRMDYVSNTTTGAVYTYAHDSYGNVTSKGNGNSFSYDDAGNLIKVTGNTNIDYLYDGTGKRVKKTANGVSTYYVHAGDTLLGTYYEGGYKKYKEYFYLGNQKVAIKSADYPVTYVPIGIDIFVIIPIPDKNATPIISTTHLYRDLLGSPTLAADEAGNTLWFQEFMPYGQVRDGGAQTENYTGKQLEKATGLIYMGARWYDPAVGQFMGIDPVGAVPGDIYLFNRYAYANNNPYAFVDPDGELPVPFMIWAGKEIISSVIESYTGISLSFKGLAKQGMRFLGRGAPDKIESLSTSAAFDGKLYPDKKISQLVPYLNKRGVDVMETRGNPAFIGNWDGTGVMKLPANPTELQVKHELSHFIDFRNSIKQAPSVRDGVQNFVDMGRLGREQSVLDRLQNNRIWNQLNDDERTFSINYVEGLKGQ